MKHGDHDTVSDRSEPQRALHRMEQQNQALSILNELALDQSGTDEEKIRTALIRGADFLGLPVAILSEITGEAYLSGPPMFPSRPTCTRASCFRSARPTAPFCCDSRAAWQSTI